MRTICFASTKGGTGKSTLAASLAVAALASGERPYLIDLDPQGSLTAWGRRRNADDPPVDRIDAARLPSAIAALAANGYTLAILDTAGVDSVLAAAGMRSADLVLIPARPSTLDIEAARPTLAALAALARPYAFVLNACPPGRTARIADAARALGLLGALAQPPLALRADHVDAIGYGLGVHELAPEGKAAEEINALWAWTRKQLPEHRHEPQAAIA